MATIRLTQDFKEFLKLLDSEKIEYLLIGGYAVGLYGVVRPTKDMDVWVSVAAENIQRLSQALIKFGFPAAIVQPPLFSGEKTVLRMGVPPNRLEILSRIAGVEFAQCYSRRVMMQLDGLTVSVISETDLKKNKLATGRPQDAGDVQKLDRRKKNR